MIEVARSKSTSESIFVDISDIAQFEQNPTTSQESSGESFKELLSNYTDDSNVFGSIDMTYPLKESSKFPAFKWECTLPENIVDKQNKSSNGSGSQRSPTYSLNLSSNSSPLSIRPSGSVSIAENSSIGKFDPCLESPEFFDIINTFDDLIRDDEIDPPKIAIPIEFEYVSLDGTTKRLKTRELTSNSPNSLFCQINSQPLHYLLRLREQVLIELGKLLNDSIDKENGSPQIKPEHKLAKRLSSSIRKARRLSTYRKEIFGRSLLSIRSQSSTNSPFPLFIHQILAILLHEAASNNVEGLMRTSSSKNKLDESYKLCNTLGTNDKLPHELSNSNNVYILADLLKRFLREIPECLLPQNVYQLILRCFKLEGKDRLMGLQYCVMLLNSSQREALFIVGAFLLELSRYRSNTLMDINSLVTVILPNIIEMDTSDPLEQSSKCKSMVAPIGFLFEHIFDVTCIPTKLLYTLDGLSLKKSSFQIALNNFAFNVNNSRLLKPDIYWRHESREFCVKSKVRYDILGEKSVELRGEVELKANSNGIFANLLDNDQIWDPIFSQYVRFELCEDESEIIKCKPRLYHKSFYLKRYNGRIYEPESHNQLYVLFQKSNQDYFNHISFLVYPIDVYHTKVILLISVKSECQTAKLVEAMVSVLRQLQSKFDSRSN